MPNHANITKSTANQSSSCCTYLTCIMKSNIHNEFSLLQVLHYFSKVLLTYSTGFFINFPLTRNSIKKSNNYVIIINQKRNILTNLDILFLFFCYCLTLNSKSMLAQWLTLLGEMRKRNDVPKLTAQIANNGLETKKHICILLSDCRTSSFCVVDNQCQL